MLNSWIRPDYPVLVIRNRRGFISCRRGEGGEGKRERRHNDIVLGVDKWAGF